MYKLLTDLGEWVKLFGPVFAFFGIVWKYFLKKKYDEFKVAHQNLQTLIEYIPKIERIDLELKPNGGSSIRDAINRIESAVKQQDQKLHTFVKSMPFGTFFADNNGNWTDVNLMLCRITERTESELIGKNWLRWVHEEERANVRLEWDDAIKNQNAFDIELQYITSSEDIKVIRIAASQLKNHANDVTGYIGTVYEVFSN